MRVLIAAIVCASSIARADDATELVARGQELARQGQYSQAIAVFKTADKLSPSADHACLIALSYLRLELWAQSEIFLAACHARGTASDPLPDWVGEIDRTLADKIAGVPQVAIRVTPAAAPARVTVSTFASDESFAPRVIHLAPGAYVVEVTAPGYAPASRNIVIDGPQTVTFDLASTRPRSKTPWLVIGAGFALGLGGIAVDELALQPAGDRIRTAATMFDQNAFRSARTQFEQRRIATYGLWIAGALAIGVGVALRVTEHTELVVAPTGLALAGSM